MTDAEIVADLQKRALAIMAESQTTQANDTVGKVNRLEIAAKYLMCCAIMNGELPYDKLTRLLQ
jgi:hypothetical protein